MKAMKKETAGIASLEILNVLSSCDAVMIALARRSSLVVRSCKQKFDETMSFTAVIVVV